MDHKWDQRFLRLADHIAGWSKDPSTQVGAVIVRPDKTIASVGYNGFPRGVKDDNRLNVRKVKYELIVHAEMNAILNANDSLVGCTVYTSPLFTCNRCAAHIIQKGITRVVSLDKDLKHWKNSWDISQKMYDEAGVVFTIYERL